MKIFRNYIITLLLLLNGCLGGSAVIVDSGEGTATGDEDIRHAQRAGPTIPTDPTINADKTPSSEKTQYPADQKENHENKIDRLKIKQVQQSLQNAGYNPGPVDGVFGPKTRDALKNFQRDRNLSVTGRINNETLETLKILKAPEITKKTIHIRKQTTEASETKSKDLKDEKQAVTGKIITAETTEMKESADPFAETIRLIPAGKSVEILAITHGWYKVRFEDKVGFIFSDFFF